GTHGPVGTLTLVHVLHRDLLFGWRSAGARRSAPQAPIELCKNRTTTAAILKRVLPRQAGGALRFRREPVTSLRAGCSRDRAILLESHGRAARRSSGHTPGPLRWPGGGPGSGPAGQRGATGRAHAPPHARRVRRPGAP